MTTSDALPDGRDVRRAHRHPPGRRQPAGPRVPPALTPALPPARRRSGHGHPPRRRRLAPTPAPTSYHLRKLQAVGLVTDTGEGEGKRRLWRAATDFHSYYPSDFEGDEDSETALNWLARDYVRHFSEQAERWVDASPGWPGPCRTPAGAATRWCSSPPSS